MKQLVINPGKPLKGSIYVPGDKSISHRALLLGALAQGITHIQGFLPGGDCLATLQCLQELEAQIEIIDRETLKVYGHGLQALRPSPSPLNCVRSGTTIRLLAGILAGQSFNSVLTGEDQLLRRPMRRVTEPLQQMGADIKDTSGAAPLYITGRHLVGCEHHLKIASAQVKSAILLAGLFADGITTVHQPAPARDHTERMLTAMGADLTISGLSTSITAARALHGLEIVIPGDISSAAFPIVAGILTPASEITITNVGINPTRTGLIDVLKAAGAKISIEPLPEQGNEPVADIHVQSSQLTGVTVSGDTVVRMIDEFPVFAVAATQAQGVTILRDAAELRVKETDRIATIVTELKALGAKIEPLPDGFVIEGPTPLSAGAVSSHGDHRLAMALAVAGLVAQGEVILDDVSCTGDSFPDFVARMQQIGADYD